MRLFDKLKTKIIQRMEKPIFSDVQTISESDVALLAFMCRKCQPVVLKRGILTQIYAYYVPQFESDINIAKDIFAKNGIYMDVHSSHILGIEAQAVLRINYAFCNDNNKLVKEMKKIEQKYFDLYTPGAVSEKLKLKEQISELRQRQK